MAREDDLQEIERLGQEIERLRGLLYQPSPSIEETRAWMHALRELSLKRSELRKRNQPPRATLKPFPPSLEQWLKAANDDARGGDMTYEQMERTMQFILDQQATMTT